MVQVPTDFSKLSSDEQYKVVDALIKEMDACASSHSEQQDTCRRCDNYAATHNGQIWTGDDGTNFLAPAKTDLKCNRICTASGLANYARYSLPSWAVAMPGMNTCPAYPGPTVCGPNGLPTPILRYKTFDAYIPRMAHGLANAFGFFPSNAVCFTECTAKKLLMALQGYARCSNSPLNQYIGCFQNQWLFFVTSVIALTPAPLQRKAFCALELIMKNSCATWGVGNPYKICLAGNNPCLPPCGCGGCYGNANCPCGQIDVNQCVEACPRDNCGCDCDDDIVPFC